MSRSRAIPLAVLAALIVLGNFSMNLFAPLVCASVVAAVTTRSFFGIAPWYQVPGFDFTRLGQLPWFLVLGLAAGVLFSWALTATLEVPLVMRADSFAWLSDYSRLGFELRLDQFGRALTAALSSESERVPDDLLAAAESVQKHRWSERFPARASQVEMAVRIVQWLRTGGQPGADPELQSLEDAALAYARDGGFVDWARQSLYYGDPVDALSSAYGQLCEAVAERILFGAARQQWRAPIERV